MVLNIVNFVIYIIGFYIGAINLFKSFVNVAKSMHYINNLEEVREKYDWYSSEYTDDKLKTAMIEVARDELKVMLISILFILALIVTIIYYH